MDEPHKDEITKNKDVIDESVFYTILTKKKIETEITKPKYNKNKIYTNMRIISRVKLKPKIIKYYKFPINNFIKEDGTDWFRVWISEWKRAFISVYKNCKERGNKFLIQYCGMMIIFEQKKVRVEYKARSLLLQNEISFKECIDWLCLEGTDIALLFDFIINDNYCKDKILPFILSYKEFNNGMMYETEMWQKTSILHKGQMSFCFLVTGYFFGSDYEELFDNEITFNIEDK
ncbi:hypothetical protein COBT_002578 [Conglomerata obtusa]